MELKKTKKDIVIELCKKGFTHDRIIKKTGFSYGTVKESMRLYYLTYNDNGFFNVNENECWIFPPSKKEI